MSAEVPGNPALAIERLRTLREEIAQIRELNERYEHAADLSLADLQAQQERRSRLEDIIRELSTMRLPMEGREAK